MVAHVACRLLDAGLGRPAVAARDERGADGGDELSLLQAASERLHARRIVRGEWKPTAASAGLVDVLRVTESTPN